MTISVDHVVHSCAVMLELTHKLDLPRRRSIDVFLRDIPHPDDAHCVRCVEHSNALG